MIAAIKGKVYVIGPNSVVILTASGVAYEVRYPAEQKLSLDQEVLMPTIHVIGERDQTIYGFPDYVAKELAELIIEAGIDRIGPAVAHRAVTQLGASAVVSAVMRLDGNALAKVKGITKEKGLELVTALKKETAFSGFIDTRMVGARTIVETLGGNLEGIEDLLAKLAAAHPAASEKELALLVMRRVVA